MSLDVAGRRKPASSLVGRSAAVGIVCLVFVALSLPAVADTGRLASPVGTPHVWKFHGTLGAHTVKMSVSWIACQAGLGPRIQKHVTGSRGRTTITIFEKAREIPPGTPCLRSRGTHQLRVRLGQQVEKIKIYDGSVSPPVLRFRGRRSGPCFRSRRGVPCLRS